MCCKLEEAPDSLRQDVEPCEVLLLVRGQGLVTTVLVEVAVGDSPLRLLLIVYYIELTSNPHPDEDFLRHAGFSASAWASSVLECFRRAS